MTNQINFGQARISKEITEYLGPLEPPRDQRVRTLVADAFAKRPLLSIPQEKPSILAKLTPKKVFQGLGKDWWMTFIDGHLHGHKNGKMVFDFERSGHPAEPGFLEGIYNAYVLVSEYLEKFPDVGPSVEFYKKIHKTACAHFDGKSTLMTSEHVGIFWRAGSCEGNLRHLFPHLSGSDLKKIKRDSDLIDLEVDYVTGDLDRQQIEKQMGCSSQEDFLEELDRAHAAIEEINGQVKKKIKQLNADIAARSAKLGISPIAKLKLEKESYPWTSRMFYHCKDVEAIVKRLFVEFSKAIAQAQSNDDIDEAIANLFQMLEWVHPFRDGQGRTDVVFLAMLLCKYGRNPAILDYPAHSTYHSLKEWVKYLQEGMEKWRTKFSNPNRAGMISIKHLPVATEPRPNSTHMNGVLLNNQPLRLGLRDSLYGE